MVILVISSTFSALINILLVNLMHFAYLGQVWCVNMTITVVILEKISYSTVQYNWFMPYMFVVHVGFVVGCNSGLAYLF